MALFQSILNPMPPPYPYRSNVCQLWCIMHILNPMPTREDKDRLVEYSGKTNKQVHMGRGGGLHLFTPAPRFLTRSQVTDWFTSCQRARHLRSGMKNLRNALPLLHICSHLPHISPHLHR